MSCNTPRSCLSLHLCSCSSSLVSLIILIAILALYALKIAIRTFFHPSTHPSLHYPSIQPTMSPHPNPTLHLSRCPPLHPPLPLPKSHAGPRAISPCRVGSAAWVGASQDNTVLPLICLCLRPHLFSPGLLLPLATVQHSHPPRSKKGGDRQGVRSPPLTCFLIPTSSPQL